MSTWFRAKRSLHDDPGAMMNYGYRQTHADRIAEINSFASAHYAELVGGSAATPRNERQSDAAAQPARVRDDEDDAAAGPAAAENVSQNEQQLRRRTRNGDGRNYVGRHRDDQRRNCLQRTADIDRIRHLFRYIQPTLKFAAANNINLTNIITCTEPDVSCSNLSIVSYNLHGFFNQGFTIIRDLILSISPDVFLIQEHWLTPDDLSELDRDFDGYFEFRSSAMSNMANSSVLR